MKNTMKKLPATKFDFLDITAEMITITEKIAEELYNEYNFDTLFSTELDPSSPNEKVLSIIEQRVRRIMYLSQYSEKHSAVRSQIIRTMEALIFQHLSPVIPEEE